MCQKKSPQFQGHTIDRLAILNKQNHNWAVNVNLCITTRWGYRAPLGVFGSTSTFKMTFRDREQDSS